MSCNSKLKGSAIFRRTQGSQNRWLADRFFLVKIRKSVQVLSVGQKIT
jgi:hypothetical protein